LRHFQVESLFIRGDFTHLLCDPFTIIGKYVSTPMDTLVGYVSYVFDENTIKLKVTQQDHKNEFVYESEETVKLFDIDPGDNKMALRSIANHRLIEELLFKKIHVEVMARDVFQSIIGKINIL